MSRRQPPTVDYLTSLQPEEDLATTTRPKVFNHARRVNGRLSLPGIGNPEADVMVLAISPQEDELTEAEKTYNGAVFKFPACLLKGPTGTMLKELCSRSGFELSDCWYTTLVKWFPEKGRTRPSKKEITFWEQALEEEIGRIKPKVIICMGKAAFDAVYHRKLAYTDINGGWFWSEKYQARVYPCDEAGALIHRPELYGRFVVDFQEIGRMLNQIRGVQLNEVPLNYYTVSNSRDLRAMVDYWKAQGTSLFSVDCEWKGNQHIDGELRSIQLCWAEGVAVYVRFMDDKGKYVFDIGYKEAGAMMAEVLDQPHVKYVGHHIAADFPWMHHVLGLEVNEKAMLDTEFALQCCDEYADLGLDRIGMAYTTLGRYDVDLMLWLKDNPQPDGAGYGYIPDSILIPYALRDVDVVFRALPHILAYMERENVATYYFSIFHPFVTDIFTDFAINGLYMDIDRMDMLRELFHRTRRLMEDQLHADIYTEARQLIWARMVECAGSDAAEYFTAMEAAYRGDNDIQAAREHFKAAIGLDRLHKEMVFFDHFVEARDFSIRKVDMMRRWLFEVKGFMPIKSTNRKEQGMPSIPWEKVLELPPERQSLFAPSTDKQTLEILGETYDDNMLRSLLLLNAVGNLCKAFLKEAQVDEDGEVLKEEGLHYFLASDGRVHGQMSTTETGRPRAWKPNCLNWPSYTHKKVEMGVRVSLERALKEGRIGVDDPDLIWLTKPLPSIRSCVMAPPGMMLTESDYKTAELRGLAFISGDEAFIRMLTEPDTRFGQVLHKGKPTAVRLEWRDSDPYVTGVSPKWLYTVAEGGVIEATYTEADLLRFEDGSIMHPDMDLHWDLAERVQKMPREMLINKSNRGAGKTGNFSTTYGASEATLERKIEQDTGVKPEPGTGAKIMEALETSRPVAFAYLKAIERAPYNPGFLVAASGRKRRFSLHPKHITGISDRMRKGRASAQGREARNFPMQTSVADTAARAGVWLRRKYRQLGLKAYVMVILYDSVVTVCDPSEREIVSRLHQLYMCDRNTWNYHGRTMNYPIETEFGLRWSVDAAKGPAEERVWENVPAIPVESMLAPEDL